LVGAPWRRRFLAAASLAAASPASALGPHRAPAWHARIIIPGNFAGLVVADGSLYSVRDAAHGPLALSSRVIRVNPTTGKIVAQSRILPGASLPVFAAGRLWVIGVTWYSPNATNEGPAVLTELNPATLARIRQVIYRRGVSPGLFGGPGGLLMESTSRGTYQSCTLSWLNPETGRAYRSVLVARNLGPCAGTAVDSPGHFIYVIVNGPTYHTTLDKFDARTGVVLARLQMVSPAPGEFGILATPSRIWLSTGSPGAAGFLYYYSASPLRLLAATCVDVCAIRGKMPTFGQFPDTVLSAGRIWVASYGPLACFAPSSRRALALVEQYRAPIVTNSLLEIDGRVWGSTQEQNPPSGLVRLTPPESCQ
jgi:hypothetical protein